jgi:hypothetical protein
MLIKPLTCAAILAAASTPALASGPTPTDVAAFSAALAGMPSLDEMNRGQGNGDLRGFTTAMRRVVDVATAVAERDYPQLGAGWIACQSHMMTRDGGLTYQFEPSYKTTCTQISNRLVPIVQSDFDALSRAKEAADRAAIGRALR